MALIDDVIRREKRIQPQTPEEEAFAALIGESPPVTPTRPPVTPVPTPTPQPVDEPGGGFLGFGGVKEAFDPSVAQNQPQPAAIPQPTPAPQPAPLPPITPEIAAKIEAMPGFAASGLSVEQLAPLLTPSTTTTGKFDLDASAFANISRFIRQTAEDIRKGEEREGKAAQDAADRAAKAQQQATATARADARIEQQDVPKTLDQLMTKALLEDDFEQARRINDFKNEPTNAEKLRLALDFATSPADVFTLSAIADGVFPGQFDQKDGITSLPRSPFTTDLFNAVFGVNQPPPAAPPTPPTPSQPQPVSAFPQPEPGGVPLVKEPFSQPAPSQIPPVPGELLPPPPPLSSFRDPTAGGVPLNRFDEGFRNIDPALLPTTGTTPVAGSEVAQPFGGNELNQFAGIDLSNIQQGAPRFPANEPFDRVGRFPELDPLPPPPLEPIQAQGLPAQRGSTAAQRGVIPEGVPTFTTKFDGQDRRFPVRFGTLFRGIKDPSQQLQRPKSFLGAVGLPRLDPGTFGKLSAGEQDAFVRLTQETGLDPRDVQREIEAGRPAQPRFRRITSAATRSR